MCPLVWRLYFEVQKNDFCENLLFWKFTLNMFCYPIRHFFAIATTFSLQCTMYVTQPPWERQNLHSKCHTEHGSSKYSHKSFLCLQYYSSLPIMFKSRKNLGPEQLYLERFLTRKRKSSFPICFHNKNKSESWSFSWKIKSVVILRCEKNLNAECFFFLIF